MASRKKIGAKADRKQRSTPEAVRRRLTREDWIEGALTALAEGGLPGLGLDKLARSLGVTKGSFYWHFETRTQLLHALMRRWEDLAVDGVIAELAQLRGPCHALRSLVERAFEIESKERRLRIKIEIAVAAVAEWHPVARPAYVRVTQRRLNAIIQLYRATGLALPDAVSLGQVAYMTFLGIYPVLLARGPLEPGERKALIDDICSRVLPPPCRAEQLRALKE